jgi:DNA-binding NarL/FixJ family response regulator
VTNARIHSGASSISVALRVGEELVLSIEDNGSGLGQATSIGIGLDSMRERAEELGGQLVISSPSGRGTSVHLKVLVLKGHDDSGRPPRQKSVVEGPTRITRILVVDAHPLFREALSRLVAREVDLRVVAQVGTAGEALTAAKRFRPDLVLLDVELPDASGMEVQRRLAQLKNAPLTLMLSAFPGDGHVFGAINAGARGYLAKTIEGERVIESIRAVMHGATVFDSSSGAVLSPPRQFGLTPREREVLALIATGKTNSEIADDLYLATKTVERIVATAVGKMAARNRSHAVAKAVAMRLIEAPLGGSSSGRPSSALSR